MEKLEVIVPFSIPLNLRGRFWEAIITDSIHFNGGKWKNLKSLFPKMYARAWQYISTHNLKGVRPIIPYRDGEEMVKSLKGRKRKPLPCKNQQVQILVRSNGLGTIVAEHFFLKPADKGDLDKTRKELIQVTKKALKCVRSHIKAFFSNRLKDAILESSLQGIAFGEPFTVYFSNRNDGEYQQKLKVLSMGNKILSNHNDSDLFFVSSSMCGVLFKGAMRPSYYVKRAREGISLALALKEYLTKYIQRKYYIYSTDVDFTYLIHFLNPFVFLKRHIPDGFLPSLTRICFKRISVYFDLPKKFRDHLRRFATGHIGSDLLQIQLLIALKSLGLDFTPPSITHLSPSISPLDPEEIAILLVILEVQKERGIILKSHLHEFIKSRSFDDLLSSSIGLFSELKSLKGRKGQKSLTNWWNLEFVLDRLHSKRMIMKTEMRGLPGRGKTKYSYNLVNPLWNFSDELLSLIEAFFSEKQ